MAKQKKNKKHKRVKRVTTFFLRETYGENIGKMPQFRDLSLGTVKTLNCLSKEFHERSQRLGRSPYKVWVKDLDQQTIASRIGMSDRQVRNCLQVLKSRGFINISDPEKDTRTGLYKISKYQPSHAWRNYNG